MQRNTDDTPAAAQQPVRLYLDQQIYRQIHDANRNDWREGGLASDLLQWRQTGELVVRLTPTSVLETALANEPLRQAIAKVQLELTEAAPLLPSWSDTVAADFARCLELLVPGSLRSRAALERTRHFAGQTWLDILQQLASGGLSSSYSDFLDAARKDKLVNQVVLARHVADPDRFVEDLLATVDEARTSTADPTDDLAARSIAELEAELSSLILGPQKASSRTLTRLEKRRNDMAAAYGAMTIGRVLEVSLPQPGDLVATFDARRLVDGWSRVMEITKCPPLGSDIVELVDTNPAALERNEPTVRLVLQKAIHALVGKGGLPVTTLWARTVLREIETYLRRGYISHKLPDRSKGGRPEPSAGLALDANHAVVLPYCDVFMTGDTRLSTTLREGTVWLTKLTGGVVRTNVVTKRTHLRAAIERVLAGERTPLAPFDDGSRCDANGECP